MTLLEAIEARHSVRKYNDTALPDEVVKSLNDKINQINEQASLHAQLILNEPKAFKGIFAYGKFSGVTDYIVMAGSDDDDLDEKVGYYGEQLVLLAQQLGLNSCWVGLSYRKIKNTFVLHEGEKVACYIALGYGETQGIDHNRKTIEELSNVSDLTPPWFKAGVEAAILAPTAINQQKFYLEFLGRRNWSKKPLVRAKKGFSLVGYTKMDLGIAKLHFEIGAGKENFEWAE